MMRGLFHSVGQIFPYTVLQGMVRPRIVAPFYHTVSNVPLDHISQLYPIFTEDQFKAHLEFFLKHFQPISVHDVPAILKGEKRFSKPALFLSFDDGFREMFSMVEPILTRYGVPATFFVNPNFVDNADMLFRCKLSVIENTMLGFNEPAIIEKAIEDVLGTRMEMKEIQPFIRKLSHKDYEMIEAIARALGIDFQDYLNRNRPYLTRQELLALSKKGYTIGAHSLSHPLFSDINLQSQIEEVQKSVGWIQQNIPNQPRVFAFPFTSDGVDVRVFDHFLSHSQSQLHLMVGTAGYKPTDSTHFLHRIPMETALISARKRLKGEFFYYIAKGLVGKQKQRLYDTH